jgi:hypothetical protein
MFILGILAFAQITLIPGALFVKLIKFHGNAIQTLMTVFGFSLIANSVVVALLTITKIYQQFVILPLFIVELIALIWVYKTEPRVPFGMILLRWWQSFTKLILGFLPSADQDKPSSIIRIINYAISILFVILAVSSILWIGKYFIYNIGTIFDGWDAVVSWNQWAISWGNSQIPLHTGRYPQLIPMNWSLTYIFMGNTNVQFFAKALMPLFPLFILVMMLDLGLKEKTAGAFIGVVITRLILKKFLVDEFSNGYVDLAISFFAFLTIYTLLKAHKSPDADYRNQSLLLGGVFAAGAAITKQAGVYILAVFPILAFFFLIKPFYRPIPRGLWKRFLIIVLITVIIAAPWYIFKQVTFFTGVDTAETSGLSSISSSAFGNLPLFTQMQAALRSLGKYFWVLLFLLPALIFLESPYRWIVVLIIFPVTLIWSGLASYDQRNLSVIFPLMGLTTGMAIQKLLELSLNLGARIKLLQWKIFYILPVLLLTALCVLNYKLPTSALKDRQTALQKQLFSPGKNEKIYALIASAGPQTKILTNYPIRFLPGLENNQIYFRFSDYQSFMAWIQYPEIGYILVPTYADDQIKNYIDQRLTDGTFKLIFEDSEWISYTMIKIR